MPRRHRRCPGGLAYHVMNRATAREAIFHAPGDYAAFERVLAEARRRELEGPGAEGGRVRLCSYVLMPNHWHLVLWPEPGADGAVTRFMKWLTLTHAQRWHAHRHTSGTGALYGARFRSFPIQQDWHFLKVCRYVERNPLRAGLVARAEQWPWGSLHKRLAAKGLYPTAVAAGAADPGAAGCDGGSGGAGEPSPEGLEEMAEGLEEMAEVPAAAELLDGWPVEEPADWVERVNEPGSAAELEAMRLCLRRGRPFGEERWVADTAGRLGLLSSLRRTGRPPKGPHKSPENRNGERVGDRNDPDEPAPGGATPGTAKGEAITRDGRRGGVD